VANRLLLTSSSSFHPSDRETLFCQSLVVGDTLAAYTATLAILRAGGQVCWVKPGKRDLLEELDYALGLQLRYQRFNWRLGRQASPWQSVVVLSRRQRQLWTQWSAASAQAATPAEAEVPEQSTLLTPRAKVARLRQAIAPYLSSQQLIVIPQADPVRVLYATHKDQRRIYQVVFRSHTTQRTFQVHTGLTLEATRDGIVQRLLADALGAPLTAELTLTPTHLLPERRRAARAPFFDDAIALMMVKFPFQSRRFRPASVPLRSLIPTEVSGLLMVSRPACPPVLAPLFQQPQVQWALGEGVGHLAAAAIAAGGLAQLMEHPHWQWQLHQRLVQQGIPLYAFDDVDLDDIDFEAIQMGAITNVVRTARNRDLSFRPETPVTRAVAASALMRLPGQPRLPIRVEGRPADVSRYHWAFEAIQQAITSRLMTLDAAHRFYPSRVLTKRELWRLLQPFYPPEIITPPFARDETPARRRHLSRALYPILQARLSG